MISVLSPAINRRSSQLLKSLAPTDTKEARSMQSLIQRILITVRIMREGRDINRESETRELPIYKEYLYMLVSEGMRRYDKIRESKQNKSLQLKFA